MQKTLDHIHDLATELLENWRGLHKLLRSISGPNKETINITNLIPKHFRSISMINDRIAVLTSSLDKLQDKRQSVMQLCALSQIVSLETHMQNATSTSEGLITQLSEMEDRGFVSLNPTNLILQDASGQFNLAEPLLELDGHIDSGIVQISQISFALGRKVADFSQLVSELASAVDAAKSSHDHLQGVAKDFEAMRKQLETIRDEGKSLKSSVEQTTKDIASIKEAATKESVDSATAVKTIRETAAQATGLKAQVEAYQAEFTKFGAALANRNSRYEKQQAEIDELEESLRSLVERAEEISEQSLDLLAGATTAGLAGSYSTRQKALDKEVKWAKWGVYAAVSILFLSIAIALNAIPKLNGIIQTNGLASFLPTESNAVLQWLTAFAFRFLIVLPGILLVGFALKRHAALFRLREQYTYKYTVAASVEGFRKQSKEHESTIAAAAFQQLLFNPADKMDGDEERPHENSFVSKLLRPIVDRVLREMERIKDA